ncbi:MAG: cytochrome P450 [Lysobacterales bacterium]
MGLAEGLEFFRVHETSLVSPPLPFGRFIPGGFLRHMAPERHAEIKDAFRKALTREVFGQLDAFIRSHIRAELKRMAHASNASRTAGVRPRRYVQRMVFGLWARLFFNITPYSSEFNSLRSLFRVIDIRNPSDASDSAIKSALDEITRLLNQQLAKTGNSGNDVPGSFLESIDKYCPGSLNNPTVVGNLIYIMHTTWSDISGLLVWLMRLLTENPQYAEALRSVTDIPGAMERDKPPLASRVVMETLRLEQSEYLYRVAARDIEYKGFRIPRGWLVRLCVHESHRDPGIFEDPHAFQPDRFLNRTFSRSQYSPFGAGLSHNCLGEGLSLKAGQIFVEELAMYYQWTTVADGPFEFSNWRHWRPSSRWRVTMAAIS